MAWGPGTKGSDIIERLVRLVAHAFCADEDIPVVEALLHHGRPIPAVAKGTAPGLDLRRLVRIREQQQIHEILQRLKKDHLVSCVERMVEMTDDEKRQFDRLNVRQLSKKRTMDRKPVTFWFIDFRGCFEHLLYVVDLMRGKLDEEMDTLRNSQAYFCPDANCGMVYDIHDFGKLERVEETGGFRCGQCERHELQIRDNTESMAEAKGARISLEEQLGPILEILDHGHRLCLARNTAVIDNSMDVMTREQYAAERSAGPLVGGPAATGGPEAPPVSVAGLEVAVEFEGIEELQAKRRSTMQLEGDRRNKEKVPPWLRDTPDVSFVPIVSPTLTTGSNSVAVGLEARAIQRHNAAARRQRTNATAAQGARPPLDPGVYDHYVDLLQLRPALEAERRRAATREFVSYEEYVRDPARTDDAAPHTPPDPLPHSLPSPTDDGPPHQAAPPSPA